MSVYEFCIQEAERYRKYAKVAETKGTYRYYLKHGIVWEKRARRISVADGSRSLDDPGLVLCKIKGW